jgi:hypothetical protein
MTLPPRIVVAILMIRKRAHSSKQTIILKTQESKNRNQKPFPADNFAKYKRKQTPKMNILQTQDMSCYKTRHTIQVDISTIFQSHCQTSFIDNE